MGKRALLVVDLQNDYFPNGKMPLSGIDAAAENATRLVAAARAKRDLVIYVRHENKMADPPFFAPGSHGAAIHENAAPEAVDPVIVKHHVSAFRATDLQALLERREIKALVFCGAMSHMCIDGGVRAAADLGYECTVIHDACATCDVEFGGVRVPAAQVHAVVMAALSAAYAKVLSTDEFLARGG